MPVSGRGVSRSPWRAAFAELVRVVRPGGLLLVNLGSGGPTEGSAALAGARFRELLGGAWPADADPIGPRDTSEFEECVFAHGATALPPLEIRFPQTGTLEEVIARLEPNPFARPSGIAQADLRRVAEATREWARERFGPLDAPLPGERVITYRIYQLP